jgi:hypothetical protein
VHHGLHFRQVVRFQGLDTIRTYGYPLVVFFYTFLAGFDPRSIPGGGAAQLTIYGALALWLTRLVAVESPALARATRIGLLLNPVFSWLVGDVLTEGPSMILAVVALACSTRCAPAAFAPCSCGPQRSRATRPRSRSATRTRRRSSRRKRESKSTPFRATITQVPGRIISAKFEAAAPSAQQRERPNTCTREP